MFAGHEGSKGSGNDSQQAETKANGVGDLHQAGTGADDKSKGSGDDCRQAKTKASGGGLHQAKSEGTNDRDNEKQNQTKAKGGVESRDIGDYFHQAGTKAGVRSKGTSLQVPNFNP